MTTIPDSSKWHIEIDAENRPFAVPDDPIFGVMGSEPPWPSLVPANDPGNDPEYERARRAGLAR